MKYLAEFQRLGLMKFYKKENNSNVYECNFRKNGKFYEKKNMKDSNYFQPVFKMSFNAKMYK